MAKQRIEYIDAMRGFTMILVVYSHICHFCFGDSLLGFNAVFFLFRLPCFFFISGWLFETMARKPFWMVARRKMMVQLVPTFIFLFLLAPPPEFFHQLGLRSRFVDSFRNFCLFQVLSCDSVFCRWLANIRYQFVGLPKCGSMEILPFFLYWCMGKKAF